MMARRTGILGGTFDPIHHGHLDAARAADAALHLTDLIVVPSNVPPHRPQPDASPFHRFAMVALAIDGVTRWRASDIELRDPSRSYTSATLQRLHEQGYPPRELFFILGADAFLEIESWKNFPGILDLAHFVVVSRPGVPVATLPARLPALAGRMQMGVEDDERFDRPLLILIDAPTADVSSTAIRQQLAAGKSIAAMVPPLVAQHIAQHHLYVPSESAAGSRAWAGDPAAGRLHGED